MKRLVKTVELSFFNDEANGEWGLCHKDTQDVDNGFNAFWNGTGIFHDVFEHSHEHQNKYFRGDYAMNMGGELAAMGSMMYYIETLEVHNRLTRNAFFRGNAEVMKESTLGDIKDAIYSGYCRYGYTLESNVPKQKPVECGELEYSIKEYYNEVKNYPVECTDEREREFALNYKQSVTFRKIADLHRYGYRMAEKLVADNWDNRTTLVDFINVWNEFCKNHSAEEMKNMFDGITFKLYKENDRITWKAILHTADRFYIAHDVTLTADNIGHFSPEDHFYMEHEN